MESTNNIYNSQSSTQSAENSIISDSISAPSKSNNFKYLFIICLVLLFASVIYSFYITKKLNSKLESIKTEDSLTQIAPIIIPLEEISNKTTSAVVDLKISAYSKSNNGKIDLILNKDGQETIIDSSDQMSSSDEAITFSNIKLSNTSKYLMYHVDWIKSDPGIFKIYDIQNNTFIKNVANDNFPGFSLLGKPILTNNEEYLIYCQSGGYGGVEGRIINLSDSSIKHDFIKNLGNKIGSLIVNCSYDTTSNTVKFDYFKDFEDTIKASSVYNLNTNKVE